MNKIGASNIMIIILLIFTVLACWMLFGSSELETTEPLEEEEVGVKS